MKKLLFVVVISALLIGCAKKDEETPPDTRTPAELILGEWNCTSWTQEGMELIENIEYYKMNYFLESDVQTFEFEYMTDTDGVKWQGTYEFEENDTKIKTVFVSQWIWNGNAWQPFTPDEDKIWEIDNLTANSLQLTYIVTAAGGTNYTFKMILTK